VEVIIDPRSFYQAKSGSIVGSVWIRTQGEQDIVFPEAGWTDFPVVILGWWLKEIEALVCGHTTEATCSFMDGPFEFCLTASGDVHLSRRRDEGTLNLGRFRRPESAQELWASLHRAAVAVLSECDARGWSGNDIDVLRRYVS
jgi:hypothetical protein